MRFSSNLREPAPASRFFHRQAKRLAIALLGCGTGAIPMHAQTTTTGVPNVDRFGQVGALLSRPNFKSGSVPSNDSEPIGRTTNLAYLNGWLFVGPEGTNSRPGSDLLSRVFDISDPTAPRRVYPTDFGHSLTNYPDNNWFTTSIGWASHGSAMTAQMATGTDRINTFRPDLIRTLKFGGEIQVGGRGHAGFGMNRYQENQTRIGATNRGSMAGPWASTFVWYGEPDPATHTLSKINKSGTKITMAPSTGFPFDHAGDFGGGHWHPIFFGDLLIYVRGGDNNGFNQTTESRFITNNGVVVYRLNYRSATQITTESRFAMGPGFEGYWPNLYSDGNKLYVVSASTSHMVAADITQTTDPSIASPNISLARRFPLADLTTANYPVFKDKFAFVTKHKVDMDKFFAPDSSNVEGNPMYPVVLELNEDQHLVETSQMSLVLGNLWVTGGFPRNYGTANYYSQGMAIWVHDGPKDTAPPKVAFHIPQANRTGYSRFAPLSFILHERGRRGPPVNGVDFTVREVTGTDTFGPFVPGTLIHDFAGTLTFTPDDPLNENATYQVDFLSNDQGTANLDDDIGFQDAVGNLIEPFSYRFSTGGNVVTPPPPVISGFVSNNYQPAPGTPITVTASATGTGTLEYRYNFDGTFSAWTTNATASHTYATAGRDRVDLQVRDSLGQTTTSSLRILTIAPVAQQPTQSNTMAIGNDTTGRRLWVVNPDSDTVTVLDPEDGEKLAEHPTGSNPRSIARDANGRYWVTCRGSDEIFVFNDNGGIHSKLTLPYGSAPFGAAPSPDGEAVFVTLYGTARIHRYTADTPTSPPVIGFTSFPTPRAIAVSPDGNRVLVTRFISPEQRGQVADFNATTLVRTRIIDLGYSYTGDEGDRGAGVPNYLAGIAISPDGTRAAVVSKQDNTHRGTFFGVGDLTNESTVRSVVSFIDLTANKELDNSRLDFDNSDSPSAVTYTPRGDALLATLQGNNVVVALDTFGFASTATPFVTGSTETLPSSTLFRLGVGKAPQGVLLDAASNRIFAQNFMGRSVSLRDAGIFLDQNVTSFPEITTTSTVATELLTPDVLAGKTIFYDASDARMSAESYISCASCHVDGGHDGRVWDFTGRGEGLRRTTDLRGRAGMGHGNVHWSANFDEIQDFEHDIRGPFGGTGFTGFSPSQFSAQHPTPVSQKTGLSVELDQLSAYVSSLGRASIPRSPTREITGTLTAAAIRGKAVFAAQSCTTCHSGSNLTNSPLDTLTLSDSLDPARNVGTLSALSGKRLNNTLRGIDTPTLLGLHASRTYLHQGQAATLADVFTYTGGTVIPAATAERLNGASLVTDGVTIDNPNDLGGGGIFRGAFSGTATSFTNTTSPTIPARVRFTNVDGGSGGSARIAIRYGKRYGDVPLTVIINNGAPITLSALRQSPDNGAHVSGWRWLIVDANLTASTTNTVEIQARDNNLRLNAILVSTADDLLKAAPHRNVIALPAGDQSDLLAYLGQIDGRNDSGNLPSFKPPLATEDDDGDGLSNLLEVALGGDPQDAGSRPTPTMIPNLSAATVSFSYFRASADYDYTVEVSSTLAEGSWSVAGVTQDIVSPVGSMASASIAADAELFPKLFFRLRVKPVTD